MTERALGSSSLGLDIAKHLVRRRRNKNWGPLGFPLFWNRILIIAGRYGRQLRTSASRLIPACSRSSERTVRAGSATKRIRVVRLARAMLEPDQFTDPLHAHQISKR